MKTFADLPPANLQALESDAETRLKVVGFIDPLTIIALIGLLINAVRLYHECRQSRGLIRRNFVANGPASRLLLRRHVYKPAFEQVGQDADKVVEQARAMMVDGSVDRHLAPIMEDAGC